VGCGGCCAAAWDPDKNAATINAVIILTTSVSSLMASSYK